MQEGKAKLMTARRINERNAKENEKRKQTL
jgi:hypothetical protein